MSPTSEVASARCPVCRADGCGRMPCDHPEVFLFQCPSCTHRWSALRPGVAPEPYDADYFEQTYRRWFDNPDLDLFERLRRLLVAMPSSASVLDVGCGNGALLRHLSRDAGNRRLVGLDLVANDNTDTITFIQGRIEDVALEERFDLVSSLAVVEHMADLPAYISFVGDHCKPAGRVAIMTINDSGLLYAIARFMRRTGFGSAAFDRLYSKHHVHHFSQTSLAALCRRAGLEIVESRTHNPPLAAVDVPSHGPVMVIMYRIAVAMIFATSRVLKGGFLQTVVCRRANQARSS